jgi:hypothetical protein
MIGDISLADSDYLDHRSEMNEMRESAAAAAVGVDLVNLNGANLGCCGVMCVCIRKIRFDMAPVSNAIL